MDFALQYTEKTIELDPRVGKSDPIRGDCDFDNLYHLLSFHWSERVTRLEGIGRQARGNRQWAIGKGGGIKIRFRLLRVILVATLSFSSSLWPLASRLTS